MNLKNTVLQTKDSIKLPLIFLSLLWIIQIINASIFNYGLNHFGIFPRTLSGLTGIFFAPFLHGNYQHLISNSFMILLLSWIICFYDKKTWLNSIIVGTIIGGFITWIFGNYGVHIGASILIFSLWGTILGIAVFHKKPFFIIASLILMSTYGLGMLYGLIPQSNISLSGHLGGLIAGFIFAKYSTHK